MKQFNRFLSVFLLVGLFASLCIGCERKDEEETYNETDFSFQYLLPIEQAYQRGARIDIQTELINDSDYPYSYYGTYFDFHACPTLFCIVDGEEYCIPPGDMFAIPDDAPSLKTVDAHKSRVWSFYFDIPKDAPIGNYHLRLSYKTATKTFLNVFTLASPITLDKSSNILEIGSGEFSEETLKQAITEYRDYYTNIVPVKGKDSAVSFKTNFEAVSCFVSRLSHVDDTDITEELSGYIDLYVAANCNGTTVTVPIDWWYRDNNKHTLWSYLVYVKDTDGNLHRYYFRVDYSSNEQ